MKKEKLEKLIAALRLADDRIKDERVRQLEIELDTADMAVSSMAKALTSMNRRVEDLERKLNVTWSNANALEIKLQERIGRDQKGQN